MQLGTIARPEARKSTRGFAVMLNESDFREFIFFHGAMRRLDYTAYLARLWQRIALAGRTGHRVLIAPFLVDQHISYADRIGALPFSPVALRAFDTFVTRTCPYTQEWLGEPIERVIASLRTAEGTTSISRAPPLRSMGRVRKPLP